MHLRTLVMITVEMTLKALLVFTLFAILTVPLSCAGPLVNKFPLLPPKEVLSKITGWLGIEGVKIESPEGAQNWKWFVATVATVAWIRLLVRNRERRQVATRRRGGPSENDDSNNGR